MVPGPVAGKCKREGFVREDRCPLCAAWATESVLPQQRPGQGPVSQALSPAGGQQASSGEMLVETALPRPPQPRDGPSRMLCSTARDQQGCGQRAQTGPRPRTVGHSPHGLPSSDHSLTCCLHLQDWARVCTVQLNP